MARRSLMLLAVAACALMALAPAAAAKCIKRHSVSIASGTSPSGLPWSVEGTIGRNGGGCRDWLFGMEFELAGSGSWGSSTGIPVGGHRDRNPEVEASDDLLLDGSDRVFSGFVLDSEVAKVVATLSNNKRLVVYPKSPPRQLREKVVWLRDVKYFVTYYPPLAFVTGTASFGRSGQLLSRHNHFQGI